MGWSVLYVYIVATVAVFSGCVTRIHACKTGPQITLLTQLMCDKFRSIASPEKAQISRSELYCGRQLGKQSSLMCGNTFDLTVSTSGT